MSVTDQILADHPDRSTFDLQELTRAIQACADCVIACNACADACLGEADPVAMRRCIQLDLDCAAICAATLSVLSRPSPTGEVWRRLVETCARACHACATECEQHTRHKHCLICADACRRAEMACQQLLAAAA